MTQHEELVVPSDSFYALALVGETTASAFRMADEEVYAVKFCVKTSLGAERDAQLVNTRIVDSNGGIRGSLNLNQPLIRNLLGVRVAGLKTDEKDYREGVGSKTGRFYSSLLFQPSRRFGIRGWYERFDQKQRNAANTLVADRVSP